MSRCANCSSSYTNAAAAARNPAAAKTPTAARKQEIGRCQKKQACKQHPRACWKNVTWGVRYSDIEGDVIATGRDVIAKEGSPKGRTLVPQAFQRKQGYFTTGGLQ
jgi:hypothetical protein